MVILESISLSNPAKGREMAAPYVMLNQACALPGLQLDMCVTSKSQGALAQA